jgi:hypothetical protein
MLNGTIFLFASSLSAPLELGQNCLTKLFVIFLAHARVYGKVL